MQFGEFLVGKGRPEVNIMRSDDRQCLPANRIANSVAGALSSVFRDHPDSTTGSVGAG